MPPIHHKIGSATSLASLAGAWAAALFAILLFGTWFYIAATEPGSKAFTLFMFAMGLMFFIMLGFPFIRSALAETFNYVMHRQVYLGLRGELPRLGGTLTAIFPLPERVKGAEKVSAELALMRTHWARMGKGGEAVRATDRYWSERREFPVNRTDPKAFAEIRFGIPVGLKPTEHTESNEIFHWVVVVEAKTSQSSLIRDFPLEVLSAR